MNRKEPIMSILSQITSTAVEAVETVRTKAAGVVVDVRKQLPVVETKKVQAAVLDTYGTARKQVADIVEPATKQVAGLVKPATQQVIDLTARGEKIVRDLTGRPAARKPLATKRATKPATKPAVKRTVARKTTAVKRAVKKAAPTEK